jgi:hypothetical protein
MLNDEFAVVLKLSDFVTNSTLTFGLASSQSCLSR